MRLARLSLAALLLFAATPATAQVVRTFATRFTTNQKGDLTLIANTLMSCNGTGQCANGRNGTGGNVNDNDFSMVYVDADADASTFSSSSATLTLPAGTTVLWAGLYWAGDTNNGQRNTCMFRTPTAGYATITASQLDVSGTDYQAFADVTARVQAGGNGTYWTANVRSTPNTTNVHAGWSLVVVYADPNGTLRNLVVLDGYAHVSTTNNVTTTISGFVTPPGGTVNTKLGVVAYEGDLGFTGDSFRLNGTALTDARNPANNFFNSSISVLGAAFTAKNPNYVNQLGFDADLLNATGLIGNGITSATLSLTSSQDEYYPGVIAFATDLYAPVFDDANLTKTVTDVNGAPVRPGDILEYTLTMRNVGQDHAVQTVLRDTLESTLTYVAGSLNVVSGPNAGAKTDAAGDDQMEYVAASRSVVARLGTGANATAGGRIDVNTTTVVRFRAQVTPPAPTGTAVRNQGALSFVASQSGVAFNARSDGDAATGGTQPTVVATTSSPITGTVFEDVNYGGGAGRSRTTASGVGTAGARVELYDASGNYQGAATTDANGLYTLDGWAPGLYSVRVVNASVRSTRPGSVAGLLPVQTFRTDATSGTPAAVTDRVGGEIPARADAAANSTNASLASLTTATTTAQSVSPVTLGTSTVANIDFGFNFDTIVNANDAGQGSVRQFLLNANALTNAGLAQAGLTAGAETGVFMVSDGAAHSGLRAGLANLLTGGVVQVTLASALPAITDAATRLDGGVQTTNVGNTNVVQVGAAAPVGADNLATAVLEGPELTLRGGSGIAVGLDVQAADVVIRALALLGVGTNPGVDASAAIRVGATAHRARIDRCVLGATAWSFLDPGAGQRVNADLVRVLGADDGVVSDCLMGFASGSALALTQGANGWSLSGSTLFANATGNPALGQLVLSASGSFSGARSMLHSGEGPGVDAATATGGVTLDNLTVQLNGRRAGGGATAGLRLGGSGGTVSRCVVKDNYGAGAQVLSGGSNWTLTRNNVSGNGTVATLGGGAASGQIGIDLQSAADNASAGTPPYRTLNDNNDADAGGNALLNFPVLASAALANGQFTLSGWARPGSTIELFVSDGDASGFGEGAAWAATFVEGSASDLDAGASSYPSPVNGIAQGSDNTNRFRFTVALPPGVAVGVRLTATATLTGVGTSEFSGVVTVATGVTVSGFAYSDADHDAQRDPAESGTGLALWAKLVGTSATAAAQVSSVNPATGAYSFTAVAAGAWNVQLDTSNDPGDVTPTAPSGWLGTENASGSLLTNVNATDVTGLGFGLFHGSRVEGVVFRDDGNGAGSANDGARNGAEAGLSGERVRLTSTGCSGGACDSTLTDAAGAFELWLPAAGAGTVQLRADAPSGWLATGGGAGSAPGSYARATQTVTFTATPGTAYTGLAFGSVPPNLWAAPSVLGVAGGTAALHRHTYTARSAGRVTVTSSVSAAPPLAGWALTLWRDLDCDGVLDAGEPPLAASLPLATGDVLCVIARHQAPVGAPVGASETATLTASFEYDNASPALADSAALDDLTRITLSNGLVITKSVDRAAARPGNDLVYTITYSNPGTVPLSNIVIRDATPPWTVFRAAACATLGAGITGCTLSQQPALDAAGSVAWTLAGTLAPGGSGSVSFTVRVN